MKAAGEFSYCGPAPSAGGRRSLLASTMLVPGNLKLFPREEMGTILLEVIGRHVLPKADGLEDAGPPWEDWVPQSKCLVIGRMV